MRCNHILDPNQGSLRCLRCGTMATDFGLAEEQAHVNPAPIDMILHCPACHLQHIDAPEMEIRGGDACWDWTNPPHRSHLCHGCGFIWRPADVPTNGVQTIKTKGRNEFSYNNHRGEDHVYVVSPLSLEFGKCACFPEEPDKETWFLACYVLERDGQPRPVQRSFALLKLREVQEVSR